VSTLKLAAGLDLPLDAVTQKFAFFGRSGSGKTYAAGKLAELMLDAGAQVIILDPVGNWWGLRVRSDGKGSGISIPVFGGDHGDVPLEPGAGRLVANLFIDKGCSAVLDVSAFRKGERKEFVTAFAEQFFHRKKAGRSPVHIILEEAQVFCPQRVQKGEERMLGAWEDICKLGRNYGIGSSLVSQRPQAVNKDVLNQAEVLVVLQTSGPQERAAIKGWIDEKEVGQRVDLNAVKELPVGTAFVWSPQWLKVLGRFDVARKRTYDASATPMFGQKAMTAKTLAPVDLDEIRTAMAQVVERAAQTDPTVLRKRIAELEREVKRATVPAKALPSTRVPYVPPELLAEVRRLSHQVDQLQAGLARTCELATAVQSTAVKVEMAVEKTRKETPTLTGLPPGVPPGPTVPTRDASMQRSFERQYGGNGTARSLVPTERHGGLDLPKGARNMLGVLALFHPKTLTRVQIGTLAGLSHAGGTFGTYLSMLRVGGLVEEGPDETFHLTEQGRVASPPSPMVDPRGVWMARLPKGARDMLDCLLDNHPKVFSREQLGEQINITASGGTFGTYLSLLRTNGLVEVTRDGIRASETFFMGAGH